MNLISDILFWISNGLLVPVVVLLIVLFIRSLLLIGSFFGQYLAIRRTDALLRQQLDALTIDTLPELESKLPVKSNSLVIVYIRRVLGSKDRPAHVQHNYQAGQCPPIHLAYTCYGGTTIYSSNNSQYGGQCISEEQ